MVRGKLPGCKGGKLAGSNRGITLVIVGIDFAEIQGIDVVNKKYFHQLYLQTSAVPAAPLLNRLTSFDPTASGPPSYIAAHFADNLGYYFYSIK